MENRSLKGVGSKANFYEVQTGAWYWMSGCRRDGNDVLYAGVIEIDEDVQEEYWRDIRKLPDNVGQLSFQAPGKKMFAPTTNPERNGPDRVPCRILRQRLLVAVKRWRIFGTF